MQACTISPEFVTTMLQDFLADTPNAVVIEDGVVLFEFASAKYSVSGEGKCVLHIWSEERTMVRRVVDATMKSGVLQLQVLRFGQSQPNLLEITAGCDHRTHGARRTSRAQYLAVLERTLRREYPGFRLEYFSNSPDLELSLIHI